MFHEGLSLLLVSKLFCRLLLLGLISLLWILSWISISHFREFLQSPLSDSVCWQSIQCFFFVTTKVLISGLCFGVLMCGRLFDNLACTCTHTDTHACMRAIHKYTLFRGFLMDVSWLVCVPFFILVYIWSSLSSFLMYYWEKIFCGGG